jgi:hypothetical protein
MSTTRRSGEDPHGMGDFSKLLGEGENPNNHVQQIPDGTIRGLGYGRGVQPSAALEGSAGFTWRDNQADGPRWNQDPRLPIKPLVPIPEPGYMDIATAHPNPSVVNVVAHVRRKRGK